MIIQMGSVIVTPRISHQLTFKSVLLRLEPYFLLCYFSIQTPQQDNQDVNLKIKATFFDLWSYVFGSQKQQCTCLLVPIQKAPS